MDPLRILLVDKHIVFRKAMTALLARHASLQVVGEAGGGQEAIARARETRPDVILMDVVVPASEGLDVMRVIKSEMPRVQIIAASLSGGDGELFAAVKNGADGYLRKKDDPAQLFEMLEAVRLGQAPVSKGLAAQILKEFRPMDGRSGPLPKMTSALSPTETRVIELIAEGWFTDEIADALAISAGAVRSHLHNVLAKLHRWSSLSGAARSVPKRVGAAVVSP